MKVELLYSLSACSTIEESFWKDSVILIKTHLNIKLSYTQQKSRYFIFVICYFFLLIKATSKENLCKFYFSKTFDVYRKFILFAHKYNILFYYVGI